MPREVADLFYHLKRAGNVAAHEDRGSAGEALTCLKIARAIGIWFHQTYANASGFKPGPFVPPPAPEDATASLRRELEVLKKAVAASSDAEAKARLAAQEASEEAASLAERFSSETEKRKHWERYASETERSLRLAEHAFAKIQRQAEATAPQDLDLFIRLGAESAERIEVDEATTRVLIDEQLRSAGWIADSASLRYSAGARPGAAQAIAIAEWPTESGPVDYALFIDRHCVAVIEAKRQIKDVPGRLGQAKRYARDICLSEDETPLDGPWRDGFEAFASRSCSLPMGDPL